MRVRPTARTALTFLAVLVACFVPGRLSGRQAEAVGDGAHPYVLSSPIFTPKSSTSFTVLMTSIEDVKMSILLRRYDAIGTLKTSQATTIGAHGSLQASPAANNGSPMHFEIWAPLPGLTMQLTYTNAASASQVILPGDMIAPRPNGLGFVAMSPTRICNTLDGQGTPCQGHTLGPGGTLTVAAGGVQGISPAAQAVAFTAQSAGSTAASYLTFWPAGTTRPTASQLTFTAGAKLTGFAVVKLGSGGKFSIFNRYGNTDVIVDVAGYYV